MVNWFINVASIRAKFKAITIVQAIISAIAFGATCLALFLASPSPVFILVLAGAALALAILNLHLACGAIAAPYVRTVARMEALATGDIDSPIEFTDQTDCVGRMAKAMETFRDSARLIERGRKTQGMIAVGLTAGLKKLSDKEFDHRIAGPYPGPYEQLRLNFNEAIASLGETIDSVRSGATRVFSAATEIRAASDNLALRNEQQAASLQETAAAMNQVTGTVKATAGSAAEVQHSIADAHREATSGGEVVLRAISAMGEIEKSSQEITQIINVIDGIAFQTNLLALNAGVEAARAGDAGRGFAVVANEVRALAQRSADAAKDIKALITTSSEQVASGVTLVGETGGLLEKIVARVGEVSMLVTEIARSAESQSVNLQQVNSAVGEMDRMTQQNAAMVEQSTAAARSLAEEAAELTGLVANFHTGLEVESRPVAPSRDQHPRRRAVTSHATRGKLALKAVESEDWTEF